MDDTARQDRTGKLTKGIAMTCKEWWDTTTSGIAQRQTPVPNIVREAWYTSAMECGEQVADAIATERARCVEICKEEINTGVKHSATGMEYLQIEAAGIAALRIKNQIEES
jgi:hypothetical protein